MMNRRDFLKNAAIMAMLTSFVGAQRLRGAEAGKEAAQSGAKKEKVAITRRRFRDTNVLLPLLGFGCMRFPTDAQRKINYPEAQKMIDQSMALGVNYFDTAYVYHGGQSESFLGTALKKYPRDSYYLATKMPLWSLKKTEQLEKIFNEQLQRLQTDYIDFYLIHSLNAGKWEECKKLGVYEFLAKKKAEGKIKYLGFSFHDAPQVIEKIASEKSWDFAQIQLNYFDYMGSAKQEYETLKKHNIPVIIMEPLRGGALAKLPSGAKSVLKTANANATEASWAFRFAATFPEVITVLSGMSYIEHLNENVETYSPFVPLTTGERAILDKAAEIYKKTQALPCTDCKYCMPCPHKVNISGVFAAYNAYKVNDDFNEMDRTLSAMKVEEQPASCKDCHKCEKKCPQHIKIAEQLKRIDKEWKAKKK